MTASHRLSGTGTVPGDRARSPEANLSLVALRAAVILLITAGCAVSVATAWISPVRVAFSLAFLLFGPGLALTELLQIRDIAQRFAIATPVSLGLETLLALTLVYAGAFSIRLAIAILATFTVVTLAVALVRIRRSRAV